MPGTKMRRAAAAIVLLAAGGAAVIWLGGAGGGSGGRGSSTTGAPPRALDSRPAVSRPAPPAPRLELPAQLPERSVAVPILMYHRIGLLRPRLPALTRRLTVDPGDFARQMRWLRKNGFHAITQRQLFDALMDGRPLGRKPILITFDDGYRDVLDRASPALVRFGMRATAYVMSERVSQGDPNFLTRWQLRVLERRGVEVGSHTVTHRELTVSSDADVLDELVRSRRALEAVVGHPVQWLAYPFGAYDPRIVALARRAGYVLGVTTVPGTCQDARRPLELRRLRVLDSTGVAGLKAMLAGGSSECAARGTLPR